MNLAAWLGFSVRVSLFSAFWNFCQKIIKKNSTFCSGILVFFPFENLGEHGRPEGEKFSHV